MYLCLISVWKGPLLDQTIVILEPMFDSIPAEQIVIYKQTHNNAEDVTGELVRWGDKE